MYSGIGVIKFGFDKVIADKGIDFACKGKVTASMESRSLNILSTDLIVRDKHGKGLSCLTLNYIIILL